MSGACEGLRVIEFASWMAGPLAAMVLADNGAEVLKVEPPDGDPARPLPAFQTWNRGKQSVVLDLKADDGRDRARGLIAGADAVICSYRPGVAERLGIDYDSVRAINPRAVYASISGYGESSRLRDLPGYEALVAAKAGRMMMFERIAGRDGPAFPAVPVASFSAAMMTVQAVLAALRARRATGLGQHVSVSLLAALMPYDMVQWIAPQISGVDAATAGKAAEKGVYNAPRSAKPVASDSGRTYNPQVVHRPDFRVPRPNYLPAVTKDGVWLQFANTADHLWLAQMTALGLLDLYGEERYAKMPSVENEKDSEDLWEAVLERVRTKTYAEWAPIFDEHINVAVDRFLRPLEVFTHRQVVHNGHAVSVAGPDGVTTVQPGPFVRFSHSATPAPGRAPGLGEHTGAARNGASVAQPSASSTARSPRGPLDGVTVVDFATFFAAPYATSLLANLGARVIKIEPLGGDYSRFSAGGLLAFPTTQGKQSIAVDLKSAAGRTIVHELIVRADLLLHNFRPGVPERLAIDYETCRKLNSRLVYLYGGSYGDGGPDAARPAFHPIAGAIASNALRQAGAGHPPAGSERLGIDELKAEAWRMLKANEANPDVNAAIAAATALLLGLHARDEQGEGQALMTTMIASNMFANSDELIAYEGRLAPREVDGDLFGTGPLHRLYETRAGWAVLACLRRRDWEAFCAMTGRDALAARWDEAWSGQGGALAREIAALLREKTAEDWERLARERGVPLVAVESRNPGRYCLDDDDMRAQGYMARVESTVYGAYWRHGSPAQFSGNELSYGAWEPVGGHTREVLRELGRPPDEIDRLIADGVVEAWTPER